MTIQPRSFTFYSYKGGVGRSMALLNMAYYLHSRGRHVLVVDLDLDAPGASGFLHRTHELVPHDGCGDVVDVLEQVVTSVRNAEPGTDPVPPKLRLESFLRSVDPKNYAPPAHPRAPRTRLDVLAADDVRNYTARFAALDLPGLTGEQIFQASDLFRGILFSHTFPFRQPWQWPEETPEATHYDYILIDSRTGFSEIGGLCVGPVSDRLVVLCGLNDQNIAGTRQFLRLVGLEAASRPTDAEPWDDADPQQSSGLRPTTLGPKPTVLVASPVPGGEMTYKKARMEVLEREIGIAPVKLSYHPQMALMETLFVRDHPDEYLALEYVTLAKRLMATVKDSSEQLAEIINEGTRWRHKGDEQSPDFSDWPRILSRAAMEAGRHTIGISTSMLAEAGAAEDLLDRLRLVRIQLSTSDAQASYQWLAWADELDTEENRKAGDSRILQSMCEKFARAVTINPNSHDVFNNWGIALAAWAEARSGAEADSLFAEAGEKYRSALAIKADSHLALYNWGSALSDWAQKKKGAEADSLIAEAVGKFRSALAIKPASHGTLLNWGVALSDWAKTKSGAEADSLFAEAVEKYRSALAIKTDKHDALNNWGVALSNWAQKKKGPEADSLFSEAGEKYRAALVHRPDYGSPIYNLGCLAALKGLPDEAIKFLERWKAIDSSASRSKIDQDTDFDQIRSDPKFVEFCARLPE